MNLNRANKTDQWNVMKQVKLKTKWAIIINTWLFFVYSGQNTPLIIRAKRSIFTNTMMSLLWFCSVGIFRVIVHFHEKFQNWLTIQNVTCANSHAFSYSTFYSTSIKCFKYSLISPIYGINFGVPSLKQLVTMSVCFFKPFIEISNIVIAWLSLFFCLPLWR